MTRLESLTFRAGCVFTACWFTTWCLGTPEPLFAWPAIACLTVAARCNWRTDAHQPDPDTARRTASHTTYPEDTP